MGWRIYKNDYTKHCYTQSIKVLGLVVSEKKIIYVIYNSKYLCANDPQGETIYPWGMIGGIYIELHIIAAFSN